MKCISIIPDNAQRNVPVLQGLVLLNDHASGTPIAILAAKHLTAMRTAAASAVATRLLSRPESKHLAILGAGVEAGSHLSAMVAVRNIETVTVVSRTREGAEAFVRRQTEDFPGVTMTVVDTVAEALAGADIACAVSTSPTPIVLREDVPNGIHINGVGSHGPRVREIDGPTMRDARILVDSKVSATRECGDCLLGVEEGLFDTTHVTDELGEALNGSVAGRESASGITIYQSCGLAIQDVSVAQLAVKIATQRGIGAEFQLA